MTSSTRQRLTPIALIPLDSRLTTLPVGRPEIFEMWMRAQRCFWLAEQVKLDKDAFDYETKLTAGEQRFIKYVLAFFANSDSIVNINIVERFKQDVPIYEVGLFYNAQMNIEDIHAHMYALLINTIIPDPAERAVLLCAMTTMPVITRMTDFIRACIESTAPFGERLLRMAGVEGIMFTGCFCAIYWFGARNLLHGLTESNQYIARDEGMHTQFALYLFTLLEPGQRPATATIHKIFTEAVALAEEFVCEALPTGLSGMNAALMTQYIHSHADTLLALINEPPLYNEKNPFDFMEKIKMVNFTDFFSRRVTEYSQPQTGAWELLDDF